MCVWAVCLLLPVAVTANNMQVANVAVGAPTAPGGPAKITFDISWENSWRGTNLTDEAYYHDAAWVFFKVASEGVEEWRHAILSDAGTDPAGFGKGSAGANIEFVVPADRMGVFIRRSLGNLGHGTLSSTGVEILWNPTESGISPSSKVKARTMAIEMVYVAEGEFWAGDGVAGFTLTQITTPDPTVAGGYPTGQTAPTTNTWPNGYNAFYLMKHMVTQRQYLDFLNSITPLQATVLGRALTESESYLITSGGWPNLASTTPYRVLSKANWYNVASYLDWTALRPYTELEFEKACRGPEMYVGGEFAWGTTTITNLTGHTGTLGSGTETPVPESANALFATTFTRVGIFARADTDRQSSGAGYWGNLDLSGNVFERIITIGYAAGRAFSGKHGDGMLTGAGYANVDDWPEYYLYDSGSAPSGPQKRGGGGRSGAAADRLRTSDRGYAANMYAVFTVDSGIRGARTAP